MFTKPKKARLAWVIMAKITVSKKPDATIGSSWADLSSYDPERALPHCSGRRNEVPTSQRQRLRPQHPRPKRPAGDTYHDSHLDCATAVEVTGQHDDQGKSGDHQEHVRKRGEQLTSGTGQVTGRHADDHGEERGDHGRQHGGDDRVPRVPVSSCDSTSWPSSVVPSEVGPMGPA